MVDLLDYPVYVVTTGGFDRPSGCPVGGTSGDVTDKFARCACAPPRAGVPIPDAAAAWCVGHLPWPIAGDSRPGPGALVTPADVRDLLPGHDA